ncbi:E3 ubiquitin-protein ligase KCMF1 [Sarcoptes scabiei]|nr:E3 ubiquitin-protein ligase KCMF1 [Sarcoptes scabiei]
MSQHDGVSCDSCHKRNFCGKRYKCLICLDYDLCAECHDSGTISGQHISSHPMQCILTRNDLNLFFGGESVPADQLFSFTCPICGRLGFTDSTLYDHVSISHIDSTLEVVCPICATQPDGEPNQLTDDFLSHLAMEHRSNISNTNQPQVIRIRPRHGRVSNNRIRRSQMFNSNSTSTSSNREIIDPLTQIISHLSDVHRVNQNSSSNNNIGIGAEQNVWRLPFERQPNRSLERVLQRQRRQLIPTQLSSILSDSNTNQSLPYIILDPTSSPLANNNNSINATNTNSNSLNSISNPNSTVLSSKSLNSNNYLLNTCAMTILNENESKKSNTLKADRSIFVQELIMACLSDSIDSNLDAESKSKIDVQNQNKNDIAENRNTTKSIYCKNFEGNVKKFIDSNDDDFSLMDKTEEGVNGETGATTEIGNKIIQSLKFSNNAGVISGGDDLRSPPFQLSSNEFKSNSSLETTNVMCVESNYNSSLTEQHDNRQKSMPSLITTSNQPSFSVSSTPTTVTSHRTSSVNKVNKVRSSPSIAPISLRSSLAAGTAATSLNVVSPNGRRKIFKQPTEPPPH